MADESWSRVPKASIITDIMDTWSRRDISADGSGFNYFNNDSTTIKGSYEPNGSYLTWIMYGKVDNEVARYSRWDMFLFNYEASGSTFATDKTWLDPNGIGSVYVKDRTPPYTECNKHKRDKQTSTTKKTMYYNRERFGVGGNSTTWTSGDGDDEYTSGVYGNASSTHNKGKYLVWRHNRNQDGAKNISSWCISSAGANDNEPENYLTGGRNCGWYNGKGRELDVHKGTLTRFEPRFEVVRDRAGASPVIAHNQGHRVMFAANVSGRFIKYAGRWKPAEGWQQGLTIDWNTRWWCNKSEGSYTDYTDKPHIFTIKEISVKTYENPTDMYGSGGERELGTEMVGGSGAANHDTTTGQNSKDLQNSSTEANHFRADGDYIYINRMFRLEKDLDYTSGHNNMVRATTGDTPSTGEGNPIGYGTYPKEYAHDSANNIAKNTSLGVSILQLAVNSNGHTTTGDVTAVSTSLDNVNAASYPRRNEQFNTMYQVEPLVAMNSITNPMNEHNLGKIYNMETILVWNQSGTNNYESQFTRVLIVQGKALKSSTDESADTFIASYALSNHKAYTNDSSDFSEHKVPDAETTYYNSGSFIGDVTAFENSTKGTNMISTGNQVSANGFSGSTGNYTSWINKPFRARNSLYCIDDGFFIYDNPRLIFTNRTLHLQGWEAADDTATAPYGLSAYAPIVTGMLGDSSKSVLTDMTSDILDLNAKGAVATTGNELETTYFEELDSLVTFDISSSPDGEGFSSGSTVYYKISMMYDGYQESPLSLYSLSTPALSAAKKEIIGTLNITGATSLNLSKRITHINLYFTDDLTTKPWTLAESINLNIETDNRWVYDDTLEKWRFKFSHGTAGATYETLNGISSNRRHSMVNWTLATKIGTYTAYAICSHPKIEEDISNYIFRSKAGRPDVVDWVNDYLILPTKPIAMQGFKGRLYVWDDSNTYVINQEGFYVEEVLEGIGILNSRAVVATDFGMCFADANNIYLHNGVSAQPIGGPILRNTLKRSWRVGYLKAVEVALGQGHDINVLYDGQNNSFVITTKGFCQDSCTIDNRDKKARAYIFNITKQRWDYASIPNVLAYSQGVKNRVYMIDGANIFEYRKERGYTREWEWFSKNLSMGSDTQLKSFNKIKITGSPCSNYTLHGGAAVSCIRAYVDGVEKTLTVEDRNYSQSLFDFSLTGGHLNNTTNPATGVTYTGTDSDRTYSAGLRAGMYIKVDDEIMLITSDSETDGLVTLTLSRGQLGTEIAAHTSTTVYTIGPSYKFPSGTKGYKMRFELDAQTGLVDSIGIIFRRKGVK